MVLISCPHQLQGSSSGSQVVQVDTNADMTIDEQNGNQVHKRVQIQLYEQARDWSPLHSIEYLYVAKGEINL
jgi:hypothetical protein